MSSAHQNQSSKKQEFQPLLTGKLETTKARLTEEFGDRLADNLHQIDIGAYNGNAVLPAPMQQHIRDTLDDYMKEGEDYYFQAAEKQFTLFFSKAGKAIAEMKIELIRNELERVLQNTAPQTNTPAAKSEDAPEHSASTLPSVVSLSKHGLLSEAPDEEELQDWTSRTMARMSSADGRLDFFADVERLSRRAAVRYHPLWYTKNKIMSGYVIQKTADLSENPYDDRRGHTDLAILGAAGRQLVEMEAQGKHALLVIPVHIDTLCNHRFHNLYEMFFQTLGSTLQRFIVLQLIGIKERKLKAPEWLAVKMFAQRCRSMIIDTGLSKIVPAEFTHVKFSVFGFNLKLLPQPEDQVFVHIDKYASYYQKAGKDTYLFGVNSRSLLTAALGAGFTYIAGEAVAAPVREPEHASFLKYEDLYKGILQ